jgi:cell division septum initiation protein DivIVA
VAGEKKFGTSLFGFKRADVNAYIERIVREFDQRLKEKDDEISNLQAQLNELRTKYDDFYREAESVIREKEKIAGVLLQAQEKAENMMVEAREKALKEKVHLDQLLESEKEKIVDIKRELKGLKNQVATILTKYEQQIDETVSGIEKQEGLYMQEDIPEDEGEDAAG